MDEITLTDPLENLNLKNKTQEELFANIINIPSWSEQDKTLITNAYNLALRLHANDAHRDAPYIYHLLRIANRITGYLHIHDAEMVAAGLLHDSVEDHSDTLAPESRGGGLPEQQAALSYIGQQLTPRVSELVAMVTNEPRGDKKQSEDEKLAIYAAKVEQAVVTTDGWIIKFCDWCDNGLGIAHGVEKLTDDEIIHFQRKYGISLDILEKRFNQSDIQALLDASAKGYVVHQFKLGHERLIEREDPDAEKHKHHLPRLPF